MELDDRVNLRLPKGTIDRAERVIKLAKPIALGELTVSDVLRTAIELGMQSLEQRYQAIHGGGPEHAP